MDFDEASKVVSPSTPTPALSDLRHRVDLLHADNPQKQMLADRAFAEIEAALERLAALGHHLALSLTDKPAGDEYPRMMYRDGEATMTVNSDEEKATAAKDGWREHPDPAEVKQAASKKDK